MTVSFSTNSTLTITPEDLVKLEEEQIAMDKATAEWVKSAIPEHELIAYYVRRIRRMSNSQTSAKQESACVSFAQV